LDANPAQARERKPEYPVEFLHQNRASYLALSKMSGMTVIPPQPVADAAQQILEEMLRQSPPGDLQRFAVSPQSIAS
jgi:hypothetical protein